jgi:hypothetical protein
VHCRTEVDSNLLDILRESVAVHLPVFQEVHRAPFPMVVKEDQEAFHLYEPDQVLALEEVGP